MESNALLLYSVFAKQSGAANKAVSVMPSRRPGGRASNTFFRQRLALTAEIFIHPRYFFLWAVLPPPVGLIRRKQLPVEVEDTVSRTLFQRLVSTGYNSRFEI